jgi:hypothetical protein
VMVMPRTCRHVLALTEVLIRSSPVQTGSLRNIQTPLSDRQLGPHRQNSKGEVDERVAGIQNVSYRHLLLFSESTRPEPHRLESAWKRELRLGVALSGHANLDVFPLAGNQGLGLPEMDVLFKQRVSAR